jgi:hypothetical protein
VGADWFRNSPVRSDPYQIAPLPHPWTVLEERPCDSHRLGNQTALPAGSLTSSVTIHDPGPAPDDPLVVSRWHTDESVRFDLGSTLFFYGQIGAGCDGVESQLLKLNGRTGVACKLSPFKGGEITLRGGPVVTCADPLRPERRQDRSDLLVEVQCRCPLVGGLNLEYSGSATPALSPAEHDRLDHDVRFVLPLGGAGEVRLGARHSWENVPTTKPVLETGQVYFGLEVKR